MPESEKLVVQSQPPWADGHTAAMLDAAVDVPLLSQIMTPSQSWRCPRPLEGESLGKYLQFCVRRMIIDANGFEEERRRGEGEVWTVHTMST